VHDDGLGAINGFARQAFDPRPQRQLGAVDLGGVAVAAEVSSRWPVTLRDASRIGIM
jgi:hypothetical protein